MMSQDNSNDLIETVTAEIEAIIQEEINSQIALAISEENATPSVSETEETVNEDIVKIENEEQLAPVESAAEEIKASEELVEEPQHEVSVENQVDNLEHVAILETGVNEVNKVKDDIVTEYTVHIDSPSQEEKISVPDLDENIAVVPVPLIETILRDAPIDENDGPRARHFKQALRKALNNTVKSCRYFY
jgi:hypothetical protein